MTSSSTYLHLRHSNRRCSKPMGPGLMRVSIIQDAQRKQRVGKQKITFGEMREMGVRGLLVYCSDYHCSRYQAEAAEPLSGRA